MAAWRVIAWRGLFFMTMWCEKRSYINEKHTVGIRFCKMPPFGFQNAVFWLAKGALLDPKRPPFRKRFQTP